MVSPLLTLLLLFIDLAFLQAKGPDQVIEIFRHGARTPFFTYDHRWNSSDLKQLTTVGMLQHYNLGKSLAEKYSHLVESGYNPDDVHVFSNRPQRCIESAMSQLSSLFQGKTSTLEENPQKDIQDKIIDRITPFLSEDEVKRGDFVPIRLKVAKPETRSDLFFSGGDPRRCPKIATYMDRNNATKAIQRIWKMFRDPIRRANRFLPDDQKITNFTSLSAAWDAFMSNLYEKQTLPGNITDPRILQGIDFAHAYYIHHMHLSQDVQRYLVSFNLLETILQHMKNFRDGSDSKKLVFYSGHDNNLFITLSAFGIVTSDCLLANFHNSSQDGSLPFPHCQYPKFASNLIFELYNDTADPYVKFYYNGNVIRLCGDHQDHCTLDDFVAFVQNAYGHLNFHRWEKKCGLLQDDAIQTNSTIQANSTAQANSTTQDNVTEKHQVDPRINETSKNPHDTNFTAKKNLTQDTNFTTQKNFTEKTPADPKIAEKSKNPQDKNFTTQKNLTQETQADKNMTEKNKASQEKEKTVVDKVEAKTQNKWLILGPVLFILFSFSLAFICKGRIRNKINSAGLQKAGYVIKPQEEVDQSGLPDISDSSLA